MVKRGEEAERGRVGVGDGGCGEGIECWCVG